MENDVPAPEVFMGSGVSQPSRRYGVLSTSPQVMRGDSSSRSIGDGVIRRNLKPLTAGVDGLSESAFPSTPTYNDNS